MPWLYGNKQHKNNTVIIVIIIIISKLKLTSVS